MTVLAQGATTNFLLPNATLIVELLAFLLILWVLKRYVWPPLQQAMDQRQATIRKQLEDAEEAARKLKAAEERYQSALSEARTEAAKIRDAARADADRLREELREQALAEVARIKQRAEEQLAAERDQVVRELRAEIGGLAVTLAERIIGETLSDDDARRATVDRFLSDLDSMAEDGAGDGKGDGAGKAVPEKSGTGGSG
jgi:F-type H+-transporting ATPase subunit b